MYFHSFCSHLFDIWLNLLMCKNLLTATVGVQSSIYIYTYIHDSWPLPKLHKVLNNAGVCFLLDVLVCLPKMYSWFITIVLTVAYVGSLLHCRIALYLNSFRLVWSSCEENHQATSCALTGATVTVLIRLRLVRVFLKHFSICWSGKRNPKKQLFD